MNPEIVEVVARAICTAILAQDSMLKNPEKVQLDTSGGGFVLDYLDQGAVDFGEVAQAALTAARPAIMEEAAGIIRGLLDEAAKNQRGTAILDSTAAGNAYAFLAEATAIRAAGWE